MNISDRMQGILQKLKGNISDDERRALMKEKFQVMSQPQTYSEGGVIYRADGGIAGFEDQVKENVQQGLPDFVEKKLREALGAGVNPDDIQGVLKNNALKSRNARVRGALLKGGLTSLGKAQANQAGLITQAGLNNNSFTPESALGGVAQGFAEEGAANAKYHDEITRIDEAEQDRSYKKDKESRLNRSTEVKMLDLLVKANPHITNSGVEHSAEGGEIESRKDYPAPLIEFVQAISEGNPTKIVDVKKKYQIIVPLEFDNLGEATKKTRNLIVTYELYQSGQIDEQGWKDYLNNKWIGNKPEKRQNKFQASNYRGADGNSYKFITEGADAGKYWDPRNQVAISKETNPGAFPIRPVSSEGADSKVANAAYEKAENAGTGIRRLDTLVGQIQATDSSAEGWFGKAADLWKSVWGSQDSVSVWKTVLQGFVNKEVVGNLPPGVASDKDIELAQSGYPNKDWDKTALVNWMTGYRKMMMYSEVYFQAKGEYITSTGSQSGFRKQFPQTPESKNAEAEIKQFSYGDRSGVGNTTTGGSADNSVKCKGLKGQALVDCVLGL